MWHLTTDAVVLQMMNLMVLGATAVVVLDMTYVALDNICCGTSNDGSYHGVWCLS